MSKEQIHTEENDILWEIHTPSPQQDTETKQETPVSQHATNSIIFNVNIQSIQDILQLLIKEKYDFVTFEPDEEKVTIDFRKDWAIAKTEYINYIVYSNIVLKAKSMTQLQLDVTKEEQNGKWELRSWDLSYKLISKVVPSNFGEKLFFKIKETEVKPEKQKKATKASMWQILGFLWAVVLILLIVWAGFLSFVVLNAQTVEDVRFFESLWINLNQINSFIGTVVTITFLSVVFVELIILIISLFKFLLTKKTFKKKKIKYGILSAIIFILTFSTATAWLYVDKKVRELPEWAILALWEVQVYDNAKLISKEFDVNSSFIKDTSSLIWPIDLKFDVSILKQKEEKKWLTIKKYIWTFNGEQVLATEPVLVKKFDKKGITNISLQLEEIDSQWNITKRDIKNLPTINISYLVDISYMRWGFVSFDASDLKSLWKAEWYDLKNLQEAVYKGEKYISGKPITKETFIWLYMSRGKRTDDNLDRIFIIEWKKEKDLTANINRKVNPLDDLEYNFTANDIKIDKWSGNIDKFIWRIWDSTYTKKWQYNDLEKSSKITHKFKNYGKKKIELEIIDLAGNSKKIIKDITISKQINLKVPLKIYADWKELKDIDYKWRIKEYYIKNLWTPTILKLDARFIRTEDLIYSLDKVSWDNNGDGDIDFVGKQWEFKIIKEGSHKIKVYYEFTNRRVKGDILKMEETIYVETIKKQALVDFDIIKSSSYVPVRVWFDASKASVIWKNISKFIWDYWDGIKEARDAVVPGHMYLKEWDYDIKLTVITEDGEKFSTSKKLILKPTAQTVKIKVSMKNAPAYQEIDFSSSDSSGDIIWYFWDFGDGEISTKANPSHFYKKPWTYKVKLKLDFRNKNIMEDFIEINIE